MRMNRHVQRFKLIPVNIRRVYPLNLAVEMLGTFEITRKCQAACKILTEYLAQSLFVAITAGNAGQMNDTVTCNVS